MAKLDHKGKSVVVAGLDAVSTQLGRLSGKEGKAAIRRGMRASLKPVVAALRAEMSKTSSVAAKNIKIKTGRSRRAIIMYVGFGDRSWKPGKYYGTSVVLPTKRNKIVKGDTPFDRVFRAKGEAMKSDGEKHILAEIEGIIESNKAQG